MIQNRRVPETGEKTLPAVARERPGGQDWHQRDKDEEGDPGKVRLSEEEFLALQAFSAKAGSNVSAVLRSLSQQVSAAVPIHRRVCEATITPYIGELTSIRGILDGIACDLRRGNEPQFDVLIDGLARLARLVSEHALDLEAMWDASRHQDREEEAGDV